MSPRPTASLSLDLDNLWAYQMTHGDEGWEDYGTYLDAVTDVVLPELEARRLSITFFIVGQDAALPINHDAIASIGRAGHEIGNHSFRHQPWLHRYTLDELHEEFRRTEEALEAVTGRRPVGFRGPGYSLSADVLRVLIDREYEYDCSTLPTVVGPLARRYYFRTAKLSADQRAERSYLFGSARDGLRRLQPYWWSSVTTGCSRSRSRRCRSRGFRSTSATCSISRVGRPPLRTRTLPTRCDSAEWLGWSRRSCFIRSTSSAPTTSTRSASSQE